MKIATQTRDAGEPTWMTLKHVKLGYRTIRVRREWIDRWAEERAKQFA